jgi:hypothetical protein
MNTEIEVDEFRTPFPEGEDPLLFDQAEPPAKKKDNFSLSFTKKGPGRRLAVSSPERRALRLLRRAAIAPVRVPEQRRHLYMHSVARQKELERRAEQRQAA